MALKFAVGLSACCLAVALVLANAPAAEQKASLMGATRDQVLQRYGEPKSHIAAGIREVMFFARERIVLRNGVVVEIEALPAEPAPRRLPPLPPTVPASDAATSATGPSAPPQASPSALSSVASDSGFNPGTTRMPPASPNAAPATATDNAAAASAAPAEPQLAIKFVRPPANNSPRSAQKQDVSSVSAPGPVTPSEPVAVADANTGRSNRAPVPEPAVEMAPRSRAPLPDSAPEPRSTERPAARSDVATTGDAAPALTVEPADSAKTDEPAPPPAKEKKASKKRARTLEDSDFPDAEESIFTTQTYLIGFLAIVAGGGFLIWQRRQRALELEATAVSHTPFADAPASGKGVAMFPSDLPAKLEWKRFEELVAAYYSKTGVVAVRTKTGPTSSVHIKISWKGEPRPFACVQCLAHPAGLVDAKPVQALFDVLTADDIRRGYVVTTGKFNVAARDFAEEKHITLLSGDIFLEKLNALPDPARAELIQEFSMGDYTTPSCPKCDVKMAYSADAPPVWRCKSHPDLEIAVWR